MVKNKNQLLTKGIFAIASVAVAGIIGGVSFASAQSANASGVSSYKPSKQVCANSGFKNYGQCISTYMHDAIGYGHPGSPGGDSGGSNNHGNYSAIQRIIASLLNLISHLFASIFPFGHH